MYQFYARKYMSIVTGKTTLLRCPRDRFCGHVNDLLRIKYVFVRISKCIIRIKLRSFWLIEMVTGYKKDTS